MRHEDTKAPLDIPCYVEDYKAHSYNQYPDGHGNTVLPSNTTGKVKDSNGNLVPNGLIQTGIAYPKSGNAKKDRACDEEYMNGTVVEFCGWEVTDFDCNKYELVSITSNEAKHS